MAALGLLGLLSSLGVLTSELPALVAWPVSALALGYAAALARAEAHKPPRTVVLADDGARCTVDGIDAECLRVRWRGHLAFVTWHDPAGRTRRLVWWPDTLPADQRRELRLAAPSAPQARVPGSMAT